MYDDALITCQYYNHYCDIKYESENTVIPFFFLFYFFSFLNINTVQTINQLTETGYTREASLPISLNLTKHIIFKEYYISTSSQGLRWIGSLFVNLERL